MDGLTTILVLWFGLGGLAALITLAMAASDAGDVDIFGVLGIVFIMCPFLVVLGPIGLLVPWLVGSGIEEAKQRDERARRERREAQEKLDMREARSRRLAEEQYIRSRRWEDAAPEDRALLEAEFQRLKRAEEEGKRRPERAIVERLRAERRAAEHEAERRRKAEEALAGEQELSAKMKKAMQPGTTAPQGSRRAESVPSNWRVERPPLWRD